MGETALPYLHAALVKEDGKLDWLTEKFGLSEPPAVRRRCATLALHELGPAAKPLLPPKVGSARIILSFHTKP